MFKNFTQFGQFLAWLQIVASPLILSGAIAAYIYLRNPKQSNLILAVALIILGLVVGILWANKIRKTKGTLWFVAQVNASPDLDNLKRESNTKALQE